MVDFFLSLLPFSFFLFLFLLFFGKKDVVVVRPIDSYRELCSELGSRGPVKRLPMCLPVPERNCQTPTEALR